MKGKRGRWLIGAAAVLVILAAVTAWGWGARGHVPAAVGQGSAGEQADPPAKIITAEWVKAYWSQGVSGKDVRTWDFTRLSPSDLALLTFDSKTQWPEQSRLPARFRPEAVLAAARDPGLGLSELHRQGITGKGISVAMIDKNILPDHQELAGRIKYIDAFPDTSSGRTPHYHGMATASILAGASVGVAPDAYLYFFAVPDDVNGFKNYITALDHILALNATLPAAQKIRSVSVSWGPGEEDDATKQAWAGLVARARAQGMEVVFSDDQSPIRYSSVGVLPGRDRNDPDGYEWAGWQLQNVRNRPELANVVGLPGNFRATASVAGPDAYAYWGESGQSWVIPYMAGLLTLGLQVNPDATFDELYQALGKTAVRNAQGVRMVNPAAYIAAVRR